MTDTAKGFTCVLSLALILIAVYGACNRPATDKEYLTVEMEITFNDLLDAIEWVESKGDSQAIGDNGRAVGAYQIHPCYVEDVGWGYNGGEDFDEDDRLNRDKSRTMVKRYMSMYATYRRLERQPTFEDYARIHNGGPDGYKKESTKPYWEKVKARLETE